MERRFEVESSKSRIRLSLNSKNHFFMMSNQKLSDISREYEINEVSNLTSK